MTVHSPIFLARFGAFPLADVGAPTSEDPKLIIRAITFELTEPVCV